MLNELKPEDVMMALDILDKMDFFQGQRAGRELWNEKPFDVQEQDIIDFSNGIDFIKKLIMNASMLLTDEKLKVLQKDAEIERLESSVQMLREIEISYALQYGTFIDKEICFKQVRAKAITEFFERVCKEVEQTPNANEFFINAWKEKFEEIAKKMKGEAYGEIYL